MTKIIDKINAHIEKNEPFFSFEFFPPRTEEGVKNLKNRLKLMGKQDPTFIDFTWGAGGSTADLTLELSVYVQKEVNVDCNMHITCTNMNPEKIHEALDSAKNSGIKNLCCLRGDPPKGEEKWHAVEGGFNCALDLIKYVKKTYGEHFSIAVSGYPEGHPDRITDLSTGITKEAMEEELVYLKKKIDAGGDFVVTQLFYDVDHFLQYVKDCRSAGINVPILPGIMPIYTYAGFTRMVELCKTKVPKEIHEKVEEYKDNAEGLKKYGVELATNMCKKLMANGVKGLHFYTLNQEGSVFEIMKNLGMYKEPATTTQ